MTPHRLSRRELLAAGGGLALLTLAAPDRVAGLIAETSAAGARGRFLSAHELTTLRALCDRLLPGPPRDPGPGALEAHAPEAIDLLLGAFTFHPPLIHAGGPFSNRAGSTRDDFAHFHPLDAQAELGWRIRIEGSRGRRTRSFAGPVVGLQGIYRTGLAALDGQARRRGAGSFAAASGAAQDAILGASGHPRIAHLVDAATVQTLEAVLGPPEYRGNHGRVAWRKLDWPGDREPRGFSHREVTEPDPPVARAARTASAGEAERLARALAPHLGGRRASPERWWGASRGLGR